MSDVTPLRNDVQGHFSIDKAAELIKSKINSQLMAYSENDIKVLVKIIMSENPDFKKDEVLKALDTISSFSSYKSLSQISNYLEKNNIQDICSTSNLSVNNIMGYFLASGKSLLTFPSADKKALPKKILFVDRNTLITINSCKKKFPERFSYIKNGVKEGTIKLALLDGWEAKTKKGFKSFNMVGNWDDIKYAVSEVIKANRCGKFVFNDDIVENLSKIFEEDVPFDVIKNPSEKIDEKSIAERMSEKTISKDYVKKLLCALTEYSMMKNMKKFPNKGASVSILKKMQELLKNKNKESSAISEKASTQEFVQSTLAKIFYITVQAYSPRRIAKELKDLHIKLKEKTKSVGLSMDRALFIMPSRKKSFGLITYQYSKVNNIENKNLILVNKNPLKVEKTLTKDNFFVFLDDFSGSAQSLLMKEFSYVDFRLKNPAQTFFFAPLTYTKMAEGKCKSAIFASKQELRKPIDDSFCGGTLLKEMTDYTEALPFYSKFL